MYHIDLVDQFNFIIVYVPPVNTYKQSNCTIHNMLPITHAIYSKTLHTMN